MVIQYKVFDSQEDADKEVLPPELRVLVEGINLDSGRASFLDAFGTITSLEEDLLRVAGAVFAADRSCRRGEREDLCRHIDLAIPVRMLDRFLPCKALFEELLRKLSQDTWRINFSLTTAEKQFANESDAAKKPNNGKTLLFSGGLDSLAAVIDFGQGSSPLTLVSHVTRNSTTSGAQRKLAEHLTQRGLKIERRQFFVSSRDGGPNGLVHALEASQRTRSFVFLVLGALVARRTGFSEVFYMAENGQMAIHLPLTTGRIGAFSTHTAHPEVLSRAQDLLRTLLKYPLTIVNPYVYRTKAEVVSTMAKQYTEAIQLSTSCWKNSRVTAHGSTHCGACVPCLVRMIALRVHGSDPTSYARNLLEEDVTSLPEDDDGRRNMADLCEFVLMFSDESDSELMSEFPELYSDFFDGKQALGMYRRFALEARQVLSKYPKISSLLI